MLVNKYAQKTKQHLKIQVYPEEKLCHATEGMYVEIH
jgi:hypothetical protein